MPKFAPGSGCDNPLFGDATGTRSWILFAFSAARSLLSAGWVIAAAALTGSPGAALAQCMPQTDHAEETWLRGTIGEGNEVRMYLLRHGEDFTGAYYYVRWWKPIWLRGPRDDENSIRLAESVDSEKTGTLELRIGEGDQVTGTWTSPDGQRTAPVALKKIDRILCDGDGPWTTFTDPSWPVSFEYPANWKVRIEDESLMVVCPDPAYMAMGDFGSVWVTRGRGEDSLKGPFVKVEGRWLYSQLGDSSWCHESVSDCVEPTITARDDMTVLTTLTHAVCHCLGSGGRIGACEVEAFAFLLNGEHWVRMLASGGALDVTGRLVDSVRPAELP